MTTAMIEELMEERDQLRENLDRTRAKLDAALGRAAVAEQALRAVDEWRGLDGDGISDPVRTQVKGAITKMYALKKKQVEAIYGVRIEEV